MRKFFYLTIAMVFAAANAWAGPVDEATARNAAQTFLSSQAGSGRFSAAVLPSGPMDLLYTEMSDVEDNQAAYYIYNTEGSFIVIAGDDRIQTVLAYGDAPLDMNDIPCGLQYLLDVYKGEMDYLFVHPELTVEQPVLRMMSSGDDGSVAPLLQTLWDQGAPYYNDCPTYNGKRCVTGCCCTSLAMVLHYWKYANLTSEVEAYTTASLGLELDALPVTTFDWDNMLNMYIRGGYNEVQGNAVAQLMRYVGQAEKMDYTPSASGSHERNVVEAVKKFGYDPSVSLLDKVDYNNVQWCDMMRAELRMSRPIVYVGFDVNDGGGHAFNVDGYDATTGLYHVNFGWSGYGNAYCALNDFTAGGYTFSGGQAIVLGIQPPGVGQPELIVTPSDLSFSCQAGKSVTKSIAVLGRLLSSDLDVQLVDSKGKFSIDKTSIRASEVSGGVIIKVTYSPDAEGVSTAAINISGGGVEQQTVSLTGVAISQSFTVTPAELQFNTAVGEVDTATFTVTGINLSNRLTVTLNDADGVYAIDKTSITPSEALMGATVKVLYNPTSVGTNHAYVSISGTGVEPKTVNLSGTATSNYTGPEITANVDSLNFGQVTLGYNKTLRFKVTGHNLENNVTLSLTGARYNQFVVTPTEITPEDAANGVSVSVKFDPIFSQNFNATLTISCPDAEDVVIPIVAKSVDPAATITGNTSRSYSCYVGELNLQGVVEVVRWSDAGIYPPINPPVEPMLNSDGEGVTLNAIPGGGVDNSRYSASIEGDDCFGAMIYGGSATVKTCRVRILFTPSECGTFHATLTLTCEGAVPIYVSLTGTATVLKSDPVMNPVREDEVTPSSFVARWTQECYSDGVSSFDIECAPQGSDFDPDDPGYLLLTGLTPEDCFPSGIAQMIAPHFNCCMAFEDLPSGSYMYRVMANYIDGTTSEWSNVETVSLICEEPESIPGDVNGDGVMGISDVTKLIDTILNGDEEFLRKPCADVNGDGMVNISDVTKLIDMLLNRR